MCFPITDKKIEIVRSASLRPFCSILFLRYTTLQTALAARSSPTRPRHPNGSRRLAIRGGAHKIVKAKTTTMAKTIF